MGSRKAQVTMDILVQSVIIHLDDKEETGISFKNQNIDGEASSKLGKHGKSDSKTKFCGKGIRLLDAFYLTNATCCSKNESRPGVKHLFLGDKWRIPG